MINITTKKPYVIYVAEIIYSYISIIKKKYPNIDTKEAINKFIKTDEFNKLSSGALHNEWFNELKKNNYLDQEKGKNKSKRKFFPNLRNVTFKSDVLKRNVRLSVSNSALRTVDYKGGLDLYLKSVRSFKLSPKAKKLKNQIIAKA